MKSLPRSTAKDVFLHLLSVGTLYVAVISLIALFFQYINVKFPDALDFYYLGSLDVIRQSMASLFIVWPVYILVTSLIYKDLVGAPGKHETGIRKWLLYLTLFVTSITIIVDLVTLVNYFLNGEITTRFLFKVLTVLVAAGSVFAYYLWDLRRDPSEKTKISRNTAWGASVIVLGSILLGFLFVGSPAQQRLIRLDDQRTNDLSMIQNSVTNYYVEKGMLPTNLEDLKGGFTNFTAPTDPITSESYTYTVKSEVTYEVCATFAADSINTPDRSYYYYNEDWSHGIGNTCFERTVDPDMIDGEGEINLIAPFETKLLP
ncbi:MAG: DUF5671 domain-containing protein [Patescibacteria group bacterium]